jgi:hypothetical protein
MNALLGMERLPTGVLPLTSVVTTVRHDSQEHVLIQREGWSLPQQISLAQLPEYVTENGNPGNEKRVTLAQIFLPSAILRSGFFLIDTPGVGSSILANTKAAEGFIPRADAAIIVLSVESPLDEEELQLVQHVYEQVGKIFVVLNKADLLSGIERETIVSVFMDRLRALISDHVPIFVLSARNAVARMKAEPGALDKDLQMLMDALLAFMAEEKTGQFLKRMAERIRDLIQAETTIEYLFQQTSSHKQTTLSQMRDRAEKANTEGIALLQSLKQNIRSEIHHVLQPRLLEWQDLVIQSLAPGQLTDEANDITEYLKKCGLSRPDKLLPSYSATLARLREQLRNLKRIGTAPIEQPNQESNENTLGSAANAEVFDGPNRLKLSFREQWLARLGLASVPLLQRPLLKPALERLYDQLYQQVEEILNHRIDLILEEYRRAIAGVVERITKIYTTSYQSSHLEALKTLSKELAETMRQAREGEILPHHVAINRNLLSERSPKAQCLLCDYLTDVQLHFIGQYQYQLLMDPLERARNAERGGLCAFHTWLYESVSSPQGVCGGYSDVPLRLAEDVEDLLKRTEQQPEQLQQAMQDLLGRSRQCLACEILRSAESQKLSEITAQSEQREKSNLCLPHLYCAVLQDGGAQITSNLLHELVSTLRRLGEDMQQFALKQSGLRYSWTSAGERAAHRNALRAMVGARPLSYIKTIVEI